MTVVVVPFREGKSRLSPARHVRRSLALAMLGDALDGTTNALSLSTPTMFAPLYGPGSADRFVEHARSLGLEAVRAAIPNLAEDVDTHDDLDRLQLRVGPRTQAALVELDREVAL